MRTSSPRGDDHIGAAEAQRRLGCGRQALAGLARRGLIRVRKLPGVAPKFNAADIDRLLTSSAEPPHDPA